jgi:hypothetical protein
LVKKWFPNSKTSFARVFGSTVQKTNGDKNDERRKDTVFIWV